MSTVRPDELALRHEIGVDRLMWGADYPHTEGSFPNTRIALRLLFSDVPEDEVRVMTSTSAADVYGLDLEFLQTIADEIGPTVEEVATPVAPGGAAAGVDVGDDHVGAGRGPRRRVSDSVAGAVSRCAGSARRSARPRR